MSAGEAQNPTQAPLLKAENVSKKFGGILALSQVSLEVFPAKSWHHRPNGSGKTTLSML